MKHQKCCVLHGCSIEDEDCPIFTAEEKQNVKCSKCIEEETKDEDLQAQFEGKNLAKSLAKAINIESLATQFSSNTESFNQLLELSKAQEKNKK